MKRTKKKSEVPAESKLELLDMTGSNPETFAEVSELVHEFISLFEPCEKQDVIRVFADGKTSARYCEVHVLGSKLVPQATINVPLDPDDQAEYRANREILADHDAYEAMKDDALNQRSFSNIVAEFNTDFDADHPLKIIGGQHRFEAIRLALESGVDVFHGIKVYFCLSTEQRLDVQLISNTNMAVSEDLFDRMQETVKGPELRQWCQEVNLLGRGQDFADKRQRGKSITVRVARTFIVNFMKGKSVELSEFDKLDTTPSICESGVVDENWNKLTGDDTNIWTDAGMLEAGKKFSELIEAQRNAFKTEVKKNVDYAEKSLNFAVLAAWAFTAGMLQNNNVRLKRHYDLSMRKGKDPLNAPALAKGRHKTDPDNYRGLGYRTDPKERGRFVEIFYAQTEKGDGITSSLVDLAIKKYHAKQALIDVIKAKEKE